MPENSGPVKNRLDQPGRDPRAAIYVRLKSTISQRVKRLVKTGSQPDNFRHEVFAPVTTRSYRR